MTTRRFWFLVVINSIALLLTFFILRFIRVPAPDSQGGFVPVFTISDWVWWMIPVLGFLFTAISWVVRPFLLMIFGRWVIQTFGLFLRLSARIPLRVEQAAPQPVDPKAIGCVDALEAAGDIDALEQLYAATSDWEGLVEEVKDGEVRDGRTVTGVLQYALSR